MDAPSESAARAWRSGGKPIVKRGWSDVPHLLRTPLGRRILRAAPAAAARPVLERLATLHRRAVVSRTRVIAVVGSFGKTTTARAVVSALRTRGLRPFSNSGG